MDFPRLVYRSATEYMLVQSQDAHASALAAGWFASVPECAAGTSAEQPSAEDDTAPPTREELEAKATELGIEVDGRWGLARLLREIDAAIERRK